MNRLLQVIVVCALTASSFAQSKKILLESNDPALLKQLQSASAKATIVPITSENVMREIADADAFIGSIKPEHVRAGQFLAGAKRKDDHVGFDCGISGLLAEC